MKMFSRQQLRLSDPKGMTLVEMMMALGISSVILLGIMTSFEIFNAESSITDEDAQLIGLKDEILNQMSCPASMWDDQGDLLPECAFNKSICTKTTPRNYIAIYGARFDVDDPSSGRVIIKDRDQSLPASKYTSYDKLDVRAFCTCCPECSAGKKIQIEYRRIRKGASEPWRDLFDKVPLRCIPM